MKFSNINNRNFESENWIHEYESQFDNTLVLDAGAGE